jgi:hypothetical protein
MSWAGLNIVRRPGWLMAALLLGYGLAYMTWGERLPRNAGFGWDGQNYRHLTEHPGEPVEWISPYSGRRCLPSYAARVVIEAFHLPLRGPVILQTFAAINLVLMLATLTTLLACCRALGISPAGCWLMFTGFFVNYAHLKHYPYAACQTDVWATAISAGMLWAFLTRRPGVILALMAAGAFVWPILMHVGAILYVFPRQDCADSDGGPRVQGALATSVGLAATVTSAILVYVVNSRPVQPDQVIRPLAPLSIALVGIFLTVGFSSLIAGLTLTDWRQFTPAGGVGRVVAVAVIWMAVEAVQSRLDPLYPKPSPFRGGAWDLIRAILLFAASKPLIFLVAHLAWFGPVVALGTVYWPSVCREARRFGPGLVLLLSGGLVMALSAESRQCLTFLPPFVLLTVAAVERSGLGLRHVVPFGGLCLVASRAWLPLNAAAWPDADRPYEWPMQRFFMGCGYMTTESYAVLGVAGVASTLGILTIFCHRPASRAG